MRGDITPTAPLRNHIAIDLGAPPDEVWPLVGNLARFPEYSAGLDAVETTVDADGRCTEYLCRFRAPVEGGEPILHRELMRWYEPERGWASVAEEPNAFGLTDALTLVTMEPQGGGTRLTWAQYYDAADLEMSRAEFDRALADIADHLTRRFGGERVERPGSERT